MVKMNEYIVYTTQGYTLGPDADVNNCQILGFIEALSENDAIKRLFENNEWIEEAGFSIDKTTARPLLTSSIKDDIRVIVDYLLKGENIDFQKNGCAKTDIGCALGRLENLIR